MNLFVSMMRTAVPAAVGVLLALTAAVGADLDSATATTIVTGVLTLAWYGVGRGLELLGGRLGWRWLQRAAGIAIGWAAQPSYPAKSVAIQLDVSGAGMQQLLQRMRDAPPGGER